MRINPKKESFFPIRKGGYIELPFADKPPLPADGYCPPILVLAILRLVTYLHNLKFHFLLFVLFSLFTLRVSAQKVISSSDASKHIGETVIVCDTAVAVMVNHDSNITMIEIGDYYPNQKLMVIIRNADQIKFKESPELSLVGRHICVIGKVEESNGKPAIAVSDPNAIFIQELNTPGSADTSKQHRITKVVFAPPSGAHYFGERYKAVSLTEIKKAGTDTIKITDTICSYKIKKKATSIYFGGSYPNQKLIIIIKGMAKQYFDEMLQLEYKGSDMLHALNGKKIMCIGKITRYKEMHQMIISDPNRFAILN